MNKKCISKVRNAIKKIKNATKKVKKGKNNVKKKSVSQIAKCSCIIKT